jgi:hypothetical protein
MTPRGAKIRHKTLDNGSGNIIEYDGQRKPHRESGVPLNSQAFGYLQTLKNAHDGIFAFHGAMRGQAPTNVDSGAGIQALQNSDIEHLGPIVEAFEEADQRVLYQALTLMAANYQKGKMINVVGNDYEWTLLEWDPEQLKGKFNVLVKHRSSMPTDKDADAVYAFQLWQSGLLGDPSDPELRTWTMNQMQFGNKEAILQKHSKQRNFANMEFSSAAANFKNMKIPEGLNDEQMAAEIEKYIFVPPVNPFDDHMIHISCHNEFMIDKYWDYRSTGNPLALQFMANLGEHIRMHQTIITQTQEAQYQKQLYSQMLLKKATPQQIMLGRMNFDSNMKSITKGNKK